VFPLIAEEPKSSALRAALAGDPAIVVWWATQVECVSAVARVERDGGGDPQSVEESLARLAKLARAWVEIEPSDHVRTTAQRLLRVHPLRAADALQLAAAVAAAEGHMSSLSFVSLDQRLVDAARREGFPVEPVS
jgi:predicted nucleic acid-binding protein